MAGLLFVVTCASVFGVTALRWTGDQWDGGALWDALIFVVALMTTMVAHEMGHILMARAHGFVLGLPLFLPVPFWIGTLGAVIQMKEPPRTRSGLIEMGAAGPLSGAVVCLGVTVAWALNGQGMGETGALATPPMMRAVAIAVGTNAPAFVSARDPLALASWLGCLLTAVNLIPFGQLDGGHILRGLWPAAAAPMRWIVTGVLLVGAAYWPWWGAWVAILHLVGAKAAIEVRRPDVPVSVRAKLIGIVAYCVGLLCFTPFPTT